MDDAPNFTAAGRSRLRPIGHVIEICESGLFAFFSTVLTVLELGVASFLVNNSLADRFAHTRTDKLVIAIAAVVCAGWLFLDLPFVVRVWKTMFAGEHPVALHAAYRQRRRWWLYRPFLALWWFVHFICGITFVLSGEVGRDDPIAHTGNGDPPLVAMYFITFVFTLAANGYLLQALAALGVGSHALHRVWHWRILIDLLLIGIAASATYYRL